MNERHEQVLGVMRALKDAHVGGCHPYLGGSYATNLALKLPQTAKDVDIFLLGFRNAATYAMVSQLENIFDEVVERTPEEVGERPPGESIYQIPKQWKLFTCSKGTESFDLIFLDTDVVGLVDTISCTLSSMIYSVNYSTEVLSLTTMSRRVLRDILATKECVVYPARSTPKHLCKILKRVMVLGYTIKYQ